MPSPTESIPSSLEWHSRPLRPTSSVSSLTLHPHPAPWLCINQSLFLKGPHLALFIYVPSSRKLSLVTKETECAHTGAAAGCSKDESVPHLDCPVGEQLLPHGRQVSPPKHPKVPRPTRPPQAEWGWTRETTALVTILIPWEAYAPMSPGRSPMGPEDVATHGQPALPQRRLHLSSVGTTASAGHLPSRLMRAWAGIPIHSCPCWALCTHYACHTDLACLSRPVPVL